MRSLENRFAAKFQLAKIKIKIIISFLQRAKNRFKSLIIQQNDSFFLFSHQNQTNKELI